MLFIRLLLIISLCTYTFSSALIVTMLIKHWYPSEKAGNILMSVQEIAAAITIFILCIFNKDL